MKYFDFGYDSYVLENLAQLACSENWRSSTQSSIALPVPIHWQAQGRFLFDGIRYHSRPEAVCGYLMSKYLSDFSLIPGRTTQVPVGVGMGGDIQTIDFRYGDLFIEYHPPRVHFGFSTSGRKHHRTKDTLGRRARQIRKEPPELRRLREMVQRRGIPRHVRDKAYARLKGYLTRRYFEERMTILSNSPVVDDFTLVVVGSPEELYRCVLLPFTNECSSVRQLPSMPIFVRDFRALLAEVEELPAMGSMKKGGL